MSEEALRAALAEKRRALAALETEIANWTRGSTPTGRCRLSPRHGSPELPPVAGLRLSVGKAGVKPGTWRDDVVLVALDEGSVVAGCLTRSLTRAAPVLWCEDRLKALGEKAGRRAILVNSGNANAFTGRRGAEAVETLAGSVGEALGLDPGCVFAASTGVIGEALPAGRIAGVIDGLNARLAPEAIEPAARAIMTTDTFPKGAGRTAAIDGTTVTVTGIAKGSGMIAPDMATMLAFVFTDAAVAQPALQAMVEQANATTFNAITVDGDTSTSDTLLVGATGQAGNPPVTAPTAPRPRRCAARSTR